ncbi:AfsR family transcriptional regulator [Streptomyces albofaciens JCM 4342]|uniref:AfsR/SARP family transcriptional regulator n=1 Tax=Streptomyces albofaciens TaxID=66866 RepID=UPI001238ED7B|nr:BTAD domain-containing putative transcriptional regulator [Streptomyces albofaciens]KAA6222258.1 AfsR family transcriptional regulator [Streptomyces albofaciens JCM 4342]
MRYGILGTAQAHRSDGTPVALGGPRLRTLLTALALRPGRALTAELLIADIWGPEPPADATGALQALIARLRRSVGREAIASVPGGYRLCAVPADVDLHRFEQLADEGAVALADGDPVKAAALLDDALALWRGPALADLPEAAGEAARAERAHLEARRARLAAEVALGRPGQALPALTALCEDHPLDEPLQVLRLRALRAAGRTAEALDAYASVRAAIADRLGTEPGPELRALHMGLLQEEEQAAGEAVAPAGEAVARQAEEAADDHPAPAPRRGNLRTRPTSFVGREDDLAVIRADLGMHRLVTLLGPGGAGKTRLSQESAEAAAAAAPGMWPDGVWFAELAPVDDPQTVPEAVLTALGARETVVRTTADELRAAADPTTYDPMARLAEHCASRRMLLVLDNCEHVIGAAADLADRLLAECPGVTVLATSREPLAVPGEALRPVEPLPDPVALRLLADRGAAARPGFRVEDDPVACAEICRRLDGLPLAIELAAARLRLLTPRQLADRLDDRFRLLTSGSRTVLPRQQTLRAVVDWSWDLLDDPERAVLRRLSVFSGGCDLAQAEVVCADGAGERGTGGPVAPRDVAALLGSLIDKSLVVAAPGGDGRMRYRLLETVSEYAGERLDEAGERAAAERRHLVAYRELARTADPLLRGPAQRAWLERLELEHDNLRTALRRAVAVRDEQEALCLVLSLQWFWSLRDHRADARAWSAAVAALGPDPFAPPVVPAPDLYARPIDAPPPMDPEQLQEARREVRLVGLSNSDSDIAVLGNPERREELMGILAAYRSGMPQTCKVPGVLWYYAMMMTGRFDDLAHLVHQAVSACREYGYDWELAYVLQLRAKIFNDRRDGLAQARQDADESLEIFVRLGDAWGAAEALAGRGEAREGRGEYALAADDYREAMRYAEALGASGQILLLRTRLGNVLIEEGAEADGERLLREVLEQAKKGNSGRDAAPFAHLTLAMHLTCVGRLREARVHLEEVRELFAQRAPQLFQGVVIAALVGLDIEEGRFDDVLPRFRTAMPKFRDELVQVVAPDLPVVQLLTGARAVLGVRREAGAADAARLIGAYDALRSNSHRPPRIIRKNRASAEAEVRAVLDDAAYERAHAEGGGLSLEEAAALI